MSAKPNKHIDLNLSWRSLVSIFILLVAMLGIMNKGFSTFHIVWLTIASLLLIILSNSAKKKIKLVKAPILAQEALSKRLEDFELAFEMIQTPICVIDNKETIILANPYMHELIDGIQVGKQISFSIRFPDILNAVRTCIHLNQLQEGQIHDKITNSAFYFNITPFTLLNKKLDYGLTDEYHTYYIIQLTDLSDTKKFDATRANFVANASHELRTPLASLQGFIETLQGSAKHDEKARAQFLDIMKTQAYRMGRLVDDLLQLSQIESGVAFDFSKPVSLEDVISQVYDGLNHLAKDNDITIHINNKTTGLQIYGMHDHLIILLQNLVENAIKYAGGGKKIDIISYLDEEAYAGKPRVILEVKDYGNGIPSVHVPRLMERFYRVNTEISREKGGTGLGLAIAKHIAQACKGEISVASEVGKGTSFKVALLRFEDGNPHNENQAP